MLVFVLSIIVVPLIKPDPNLPAWFMIPAGLLTLVLWYYVSKEMAFDLVDEVWDAGDGLIIRNRNQEERIALTDVTEVNYSLWDPRVTLVLRRPSTFGTQIQFLAPRRFLPLLRNRAIKGLIERIDATRGA
jgi:hypothetical protein